MKPDFHDCPGGCGASVPRKRFACRSCWDRLPERLRNDILRFHYRKSRSHMAAMGNAIEWYLSNPLPEKGHHP